MMIDLLAPPPLPRSGLAGLMAAGAMVMMATAMLTAGLAQATPRATSFTLDNGMEVVVIPDHRAPVVTHMVWYKAGAADEPPGASGIAHFLEHLMFKGTEKIPSGQFSRIIARNGGEDNAFTSHDVTAYFQRVAKDRLAMVMDMEADRMVNLVLTEEEVATERMVILEERRSRIDNDPSSILQEQMMAALYFAHPYGIPVLGWEHEMQRLSREDALAFYRRFYAPDNAILVIAGDVTPEEALSLAEKTYGSIPARDIGDRVRPQEPKHHAAIRVVLEDARAGRATLQRYYLAPSYATAEPGEAEALELLLRIAGSGSASRLYKKLVIEDKLAAGAGGWYGGYGLDSGRIGLYAVASDAAAISDIEAALDAVLADIREGGVTQQELDRARSALLASHVYSSDSQSSLARRYGWSLANGLTVADVESWPERIARVTVDDVQRAAQKHLDITQSVTGVLIPKTSETAKTGDAAPEKRS